MLIAIPLVAHTTDTINVKFESKEVESQAKADLKRMSLSKWLDKYCPDYVDEIETYHYESFEIDDETLEVELAEDYKIED